MNDNSAAKASHNNELQIKGYITVLCPITVHSHYLSVSSITRGLACPSFNMALCGIEVLQKLQLSNVIRITAPRYCSGPLSLPLWDLLRGGGVGGVGVGGWELVAQLTSLTGTECLLHYNSGNTMPCPTWTPPHRKCHTDSIGKSACPIIAGQQYQSLPISLYPFSLSFFCCHPNFLIQQSQMSDFYANATPYSRQSQSVNIALTCKRLWVS